MSITCDCCNRSAHFDAFTTSSLSRFACPFCFFEFGLRLESGSTGRRRVRTVVYNDPRQQQLIDLAGEGDECAQADLFKECLGR
jgi:transposase-like protein